MNHNKCIITKISDRCLPNTACVFTLSQLVNWPVIERQNLSSPTKAFSKTSSRVLSKPINECEKLVPT